MQQIALLMGDKLYYIIDHLYPLKTTVMARGCAPNPKFGKLYFNKSSIYLSCILQAVLVYSPNGIEQDPNSKLNLREHLILIPKVDEPETQLGHLRPMRERRVASRLGEYIVTKTAQ